MEEDIKILEEMITWDCLLPNKRQTEAIENLIKGYRELEKSKITYERARDLQEENKRIVDNNYIPTSKIKEKIEEIRNKLTWGYIDWKYDEKVYMAEHHMLDRVEKELMEDK